MRLWHPSIFGTLRNRTAGRLRTAEWRKNVAQDRECTVSRDIFASFCRHSNPRSRRHWACWPLANSTWTPKSGGSMKENCWFSLSHHHQNHSTNKVKRQRGKRRWILKQCRKNSGLCNVSCGRYSKKCFTQICKAMYGDAMFASLWGAQIWRPEANKNICHRVFYKEPVVVFWGPINIYMRTYSHARTVQIVKSQRISYFF